MKTLLKGLGSADLRVAVALSYTAIILTAMEYWWLPFRVEQRIREAAGKPNFGPTPAPSLQAGASWSAACIVGFLLLPLLITLFLHRDKPSSIGFRFQGFLRHVWVYLGLYLVMLPFILMAAEQPEFLATYPFVSSARGELSIFVRWELAYLAQFIALEAFFRGYLLFTLEKRMGWNAAYVMAVPYCMIHWHKPPLEAFGALIAGVVLGSLALRFRSWLGGALLHGLVALTMDALAVKKAGLF